VSCLRILLSSCSLLALTLVGCSKPAPSSNLAQELPIAASTDLPQEKSVAKKTILGRSIEAYQLKSDVHIHNLANSGTPAFKRREVNLSEATGAAVASTDDPAIGGCKVGSVRIDFRPGKLQITDRPLDLAIEGKGFFQVTNSNGEILYSRAGRLRIDANGQLATSAAHILEPAITIPQDTFQITVNQAGEVYASQHGIEMQVAVGAIQLAHFVNPADLQPLEDGYYAKTDRSGAPTTSCPGQHVLGVIRQGMQEASNVDPVLEKAELERCQAMLEQLISLSRSAVTD
jgi:flagellar basal-body rod protein FlgG